MLALLEVDRATAPVRLWIDFGVADAHLKVKEVSTPMYQKKRTVTVHKTAADMVRGDEANKSWPLQQAIKSNRF